MGHDVGDIVLAAVIAHDMGVAAAEGADPGRGAGRGPRRCSRAGGRERRACRCCSSAARAAEQRATVLAAIRDIDRGRRRRRGGRAGWCSRTPTRRRWPRLVAAALRRARVILTLDLGTTRTKAVAVGRRGTVASGDATRRPRVHPAPGRAEQDPHDWWASVVGRLRARCGGLGATYGAVEAVGFAAARQTFVPGRRRRDPARARASLWSDRRAGSTPAAGCRLGRGQAWPWLAMAHEPARWRRSSAGSWRPRPDRLAAARWILAPRDLSSGA